MNPFGVAVWGSIAMNNEKYGLTDIQLHLDNLAEEYECILMEKYHDEQRNEQNQVKSNTIDISRME